MKHILLSITAALFTCTAVFGSGPSDGLTNKEVTAALKKLQKQYPDLAEMSSIGTTAHKNDIWVIRITGAPKNRIDAAGALLVCSNTDADYLTGSSGLIAVARQLLAKAGTDAGVKKLLAERAVYIIPRLNPDGAEHIVRSGPAPLKGNLAAFDNDHDGLTDEDGPEDLNGDGLITLIRYKDPAGTLLPDPADPRLLITADPLKGETGIYTTVTEGVDIDKDGLINEDGPGGILIDRNFPHAYPYHKDGAGPYMTSEAETRAIIDFMYGHKHIAAVVHYAPFDNLLNPPEPQRQRPETAGNQPERRFMRVRKAPDAVNQDDVLYYRNIGSRYEKILGFSASRTQEAESPAGSFTQWAYFQYGVPSFSTPFWQLPAAAGSDSSSGKLPPGKEKRTYKKQLLDWIDRENPRAGFVSWQPFNHPDLGSVEIGGFHPLVTSHAGLVTDSLAAGHAEFILELTSLLPRISLEELTVTQKASRVFRIEAVIKNTGFFPTHFKQGEIARSVDRTRAELSAEKLSLLEGTPRIFLDTLAGSGGSCKVSWLLNAAPGSDVTLTVRSEKAGTIVKDITLNGQE